MADITINFSDALVAPFLLNNHSVPDCLLYRAWYLSDTYKTIDELDHMKKQFVLENRLKINRTYKVEVLLYDERFVKSHRQRTYEINFLCDEKIDATLRLTYLREVQDEVRD